MNIQKLERKLDIDASAVEAGAEERFFQICSFDLSEPGQRKMEETAFSVREHLQSQMKIQAVVRFYPNPILMENTLQIGDMCISCQAFRQFPGEAVKGAFVCLLTIGETDMEGEADIMTELYHDIWGTCYVESAMEMMRKDCLPSLLKKLHPQQELYLSETFGPGYYGMNMEEGQKLFAVLDGASIGVSQKAGCLLVPEKSCLGLMLVCDREDIKMPRACSRCLGGHGGCRFCDKRNREKPALLGREDVAVKTSMVQLPKGFVPDRAQDKSYGIALDLGTTTMVVMLWNLTSGTLEDLEAVTNPQRSYGADVMSRIGFALETSWNLKLLRQSMIRELNQTISRLTAKCGMEPGQIRKVVAVGNTTMSHVFLGEDVSGLAVYPFAPAFTGSVCTTAGRLGLAAHKEAEVYVGPNIAGHVGSDVTAGILAAGYMEEENRDNRMFFDMGTNGEILLTTRENAYCCSTAAGPAFEGGALHQGMRAAPGAICKVNMKDGIVKVETVGEEPAIGICGSGIIDAVAAMVECGAVDGYGRIEGENEVNDFLLTPGDESHPPVFVTQQDVREIQMAKAAVAAGSGMLLKKAGLSVEDLKEVGIAGAFGNAMDLESGQTIGLLPQMELSKMRGLGNGAGIGASMLLLSADCREKAEKIAVSVEHVELAASAAFQSQYIEEMNFRRR